MQGVALFLLYLSNVSLSIYLEYRLSQSVVQGVTKCFRNRNHLRQNQSQPLDLVMQPPFQPLILWKHIHLNLARVWPCSTPHNSEWPCPLLPRTNKTHSSRVKLKIPLSLLSLSVLVCLSLIHFFCSSNCTRIPCAFSPVPFTTSYDAHSAHLHPFPFFWWRTFDASSPFQEDFNDATGSIKLSASKKLPPVRSHAWKHWGNTPPYVWSTRRRLLVSFFYHFDAEPTGLINMKRSNVSTKRHKRRIIIHLDNLV